ncbi:MAG: PssD/Cps14F family polysaccharide biosynthesis glycosyltransferase [Candidatus Aenigmatarchaeota archaeon]
MKICIVSSAGGHLKEMNRLLPILRKRDYFYITFAEEAIASGLVGRVYRVVNPDVRNRKLGPKAFVKNFSQVLGILKKEKPDVVMTSGAGVALAPCYLAKMLFGAKIIFIETSSRFDRPSLIGRMLYPIADMFLVQWPGVLKHYGGKAKYAGCLFG